MKLQLAIPALVIAALGFSGCTSIVKVAPFPSPTAWDDPAVKKLGPVSADSGVWPLSLHSVPDYTIQSTLRSNASNKYKVPADQIVLSEATVQVGAELDGTIRDWKATAEAGQLANGGAEKTPAQQLTELKKLLDAGLISKADYETKKAAILQKM